MKVLLITPEEHPKTVEIDGSLKSMQEIVEGYIQPFCIDEEVVLICNEEGKINGLPLNRAVYNEDGKLIEIIAGTFFICAAPSTSENFKSLNDEQIEKYEKMFYHRNTFFKVDGILRVGRY